MSATTLSQLQRVCRGISRRGEAGDQTELGGIHHQLPGDRRQLSFLLAGVLPEQAGHHQMLSSLRVHHPRHIATPVQQFRILESCIQLIISDLLVSQYGKYVGPAHRFYSWDWGEFWLWEKYFVLPVKKTLPPLSGYNKMHLRKNQSMPTL